MRLKFKFKYKLSPAQVELFKDNFPEFETEVNTSTCKFTGHPFAATIRDAEHELLLSRLPPCALVLDFGGDYTRHLTRAQAVHSCAPLQSVRDMARATSRAMTLRRFTTDYAPDHEFRTRHQSGTHATHCDSHAETCDVHGEFAICVHSIYDIGLTNLAAAMIRHKTLVTLGTFIFSPEILIHRTGTLQPLGVRYERDSEYIRFSFINDPSLGYEHRWDQYYELVTTHIIRDPGHTFLYELLENRLGIQVFRLTAVDKVTTATPQHFVNTLWFRDYDDYVNVRVLDVKDHTPKDGLPISINTEQVWVPSGVYRAGLASALGTKSGLTVVGIFNAMRSRDTRQTVNGTEIVTKGDELDPLLLRRVALSIYLHVVTLNADSVDLTEAHSAVRTELLYVESLSLSGILTWCRILFRRWTNNDSWILTCLKRYLKDNRYYTDFDPLVFRADPAINFDTWYSAEVTQHQVRTIRYLPEGSVPTIEERKIAAEQENVARKEKIIEDRAHLTAFEKIALERAESNLRTTHGTHDPRKCGTIPEDSSDTGRVNQTGTTNSIDEEPQRTESLNQREADNSESSDDDDDEPVVTQPREETMDVKSVCADLSESIDDPSGTARLTLGETMHDRVLDYLTYLTYRTLASTQAMKLAHSRFRTALASGASEKSLDASLRMDGIMYAQRVNATNFRVIGDGLTHVPYTVVDSEGFLCSVDTKESTSRTIVLSLPTNVAHVMFAIDEVNNSSGAILKGIATSVLTIRPYATNLVDGVPGCGKTTEIIERATAGSVLLTGTRAAADDLRRRFKIAKPTTKVHISTLDAYLIFDRRTTDQLIIDEALMLHPGAVALATQLARPTKPVLLFGDSQQLRFESRQPGYHLPYQLESADWTTTTRRTMSYTVPQDIVFALQEYYPDGFTSSSKVTNSVSIMKTPVCPKGEANWAGLSYNQVEKKVLISKGHVEPHTVHEAQGHRYTHTMLVRTEHKALPTFESRAHVIVALTRHSQFMVYATCNDRDLTSTLISKAMTYETARQVNRTYAVDIETTSPTTTTTKVTTVTPVVNPVIMHARGHRLAQPTTTLPLVPATPKVIPPVVPVDHTPLYQPDNPVVLNKGVKTQVLSNWSGLFRQAINWWTARGSVTRILFGWMILSNILSTPIESSILLLVLSVWTGYSGKLPSVYAAYTVIPLLMVLGIPSAGSLLGLVTILHLTGGVGASVTPVMPQNPIERLITVVTPPSVDVISTTLTQWAEHLTTAANQITAVLVSTLNYVYENGVDMSTTIAEEILLVYRAGQLHPRVWCSYLIAHAHEMFHLLRDRVTSHSSWPIVAPFYNWLMTLVEHRIEESTQALRVIALTHVEYGYAGTSFLRRMFIYLTHNLRVLYDVIRLCDRERVVSIINLSMTLPDQIYRVSSEFLHSDRPGTAVSAAFHNLLGLLERNIGVLRDLLTIHEGDSVLKRNVFYSLTLPLDSIANLALFVIRSVRTTIPYTTRYSTPETRAVDDVLKPYANQVVETVRHMARHQLTEYLPSSDSHEIITHTVTYAQYQHYKIRFLQYLSELGDVSDVILPIGYLCVTAALLFVLVRLRLVGNPKTLFTIAFAVVLHYITLGKSVVSALPYGDSLFHLPGDTTVVSHDICVVQPVDVRTLCTSKQKLYQHIVELWHTMDDVASGPVTTTTPVIIDGLTTTMLEDYSIIQPLDSIERYLQEYSDTPLYQDAYIEDDVEFGDLDTTMQDCRFSTSKLERTSSPSEQILDRYVHPTINTAQPGTRVDTARQLYLTMYKRNWNTPRLATLMPHDSMIARTIDRVFNLIGPKLPRDQQLTGGHPHFISDWVKRLPLTKVKAINGRFKQWEARDIDHYNVMVKTEAKNKLTRLSNREYLPLHNIVFHENYVNAAFSPVFAEITHRIIESLPRNICFFTRQSLTALQDRINECLDSASEYDVVEVDFGKFDKSQEAQTYALEYAVYKKYGLNQRLLEHWAAGHQTTTLRSWKHAFKAYIRYQRKSGDATTTLGNTVVNMFTVLEALKAYGTPSFAAFLGDDSVLYYPKGTITRAPEVLNQLPSDIALRYNLEAKALINAYGYFCSRFIVLAHGRYIIIPDPYKRAERLGRPIPKREFALVIRQRHQALNDDLRYLRSETVRNIVTEVLTKRYGYNTNTRAMLMALSTLTREYSEYKQLFSTTDIQSGNAL
nr:MAG: polyprotein [XiangYun hepe-virga-like virus 3]